MLLKRVGYITAITGLALFLTSFLLFGRAIITGVQAHKVASFPVSVGETFHSSEILVNTERNCQINVAVRATTSSIHKIDDNFHHVQNHGSDHEVPYSFPLIYTVTDVNGQEIFSKVGEMSWDSGTRTYRSKDAMSAQGSVDVTHRFAKFKVPPPGKISIEVTVQPDIVFQAKAETIEVQLLDNVTKQGRNIGGGLLALVSGLAIFFVGCVFIIVGFATASSSAAEPLQYD